MTSISLTKLRTKGKTLTAQELKELDTRVITLEKITQIESRLRRLESRKRTSETPDGPKD
jgi:hypothetical protein